jgi:hypothetical protein
MWWLLVFRSECRASGDPIQSSRFRTSGVSNYHFEREIITLVKVWNVGVQIEIQNEINNCYESKSVLTDNIIAIKSRLAFLSTTVDKMAHCRTCWISYWPESIQRLNHLDEMIFSMQNMKFNSKQHVQIVILHCRKLPAENIFFETNSIRSHFLPIIILEKKKKPRFICLCL